jgi:hypothetical protein
MHELQLAALVVVVAAAPAAPPPPLDKLWNETLAATGAPPEGDAEVLALVADALRGAATERGIELEIRTATSTSSPSVIIEGKTVRPARHTVAPTHSRVPTLPSHGLTVLRTRATGALTDYSCAQRPGVRSATR